MFEAGTESAGLLKTFEVGGEPVECFYHHAFRSDTALIRLLGELGLGSTLTWKASRIGVFHEGRVHPFTTALDLLRFAPLGAGDRVRLGLMGLGLRRERDGSKFEQVTAADWVRSHAGERALEVVWRPLLRGKFGEMADEVVMSWLWSKVHLRFGSRRGMLSQREVLGYQSGSFKRWIEALITRITELGGTIALGCAVSRIDPSGGTLQIEGEGFDAAIATVANTAFLRIAPALPDDYARKLERVRYQDAHCLVLTLKRPLTDRYWINISDPDVPFVAVIEHTNLVGSERYGGQHIVYLANYAAPGAAPAEKNVEEVWELYRPHVARLNPSFDESWISERRLFHAANAQPVFTVGAGSRIPAMRTPISGLYLANMAQIYPQDRGQNYSIVLGEKAAAMVAADLARAGVPQYQV